MEDISLMRKFVVHRQSIQPLVAVVGECQGSCRLNYVMVPPIDEAAVLAAQMSGDANLRLVMSVPRLRRRTPRPSRRRRTGRQRGLT